MVIIIIVLLYSSREARGPVQLLAFRMCAKQSIGAQLKKMTAIFESEFPNDAFEPLQVLEPDAGRAFGSYL